MSELLPYQFFLLAISLLLCLISIISFHEKRNNTAIVALLLSAAGIRFFMISYYPFLNDWDERFHALVAKNMIDHPFKPMLFANPVLPFDYKMWCCNHIWIHKQPLFLWQMALSMNLFGVNEVALRLPSAMLGTIQVFLIYRIGKLLKNNQTGYYAALFFAVAFYPLQLIAGVADMDHIRVAFGFYVCASIWALSEYFRTKRIVWIVMIGICSGAAVLNMWLAGLIVYGAWALVTLHQSNYKWTHLVNENRIEILRITGSFVIALIVFVPWQVYTNYAFPLESAYEAQWNERHITEALEDHAGPWYYYLIHLPLQFGKLFTFIIPFAIASLFVKPRANTPLLIVLLFCLLVPYLFFSLVVQTRMPSYVYMSHFVVWIALGSLFSLAMEKFYAFNLNKFYRYAVSFLLFGICLTSVLKINATISSELLSAQVPDLNKFLDKKNHNTEIFKKLNEIVPDGYVVFNCNSFENVEAMFYSDRTAYHWYPTEMQIDSLIRSGHKIAVFDSHQEYVLPHYLKTNPEVMIIDAKLY